MAKFDPIELDMTQHSRRDGVRRTIRLEYRRVLNLIESYPIRFQLGVPPPEFLRYFATEAHCVDAQTLARWQGGFNCPDCAATARCNVNHGTKPICQCNACRHQTSLTAGTLFAIAKLPLTATFFPFHLISQAKTGLSTLALKRQLGVSCPAAWLMHHNTMRAIADCGAQEWLAGHAQIDCAYRRGEINGAKAGRGSSDKGPFVAQVAVNDEGNPIHLKPSLVARFSRDAIAQWAMWQLSPGTIVASDSLPCFPGFTDAGCIHASLVVGQLQSRDMPKFKWANTILCNRKSTLSRRSTRSDSKGTSLSTSVRSLTNSIIDSTSQNGLSRCSSKPRRRPRRPRG